MEDCVDGTVIYRGTLVLMLGDSLGTHQIGGFTENFSKSLNFCRFCEILRAQLEANDYSPKALRTPESYDECVIKALRMGKMFKGIKKNSPLNQIKSYHVCNPGLPPCIAHDLFEGIVQYDLMLAIKYFLKKHWFRVGLLNYRLQNVRLSTDNTSTNCLPIIKESYTKVCGTASNMKRLLHILPVAIHDLVRDNRDPVWRMILCLREVCSIICAPALKKGQIVVLDSKIDQYLQLRIRCFADERLKPKHHFLCHYPTLIEELGPMKHLQTIRLESKHKFMKNTAKHCQNFKNITKTLSTKHQEMEAPNEGNFLSLVEFSETWLYQSEYYRNEINSLIEFAFEENVRSSIKISKKVTFHGVEYKNNMSICIGKSIWGNFIMCRIQLILINNNKLNIFFIGHTTEIVANLELGVYESIDINKATHEILQLFPYSSLLAPHPFPEVVLTSSIAVYLPRYAPFDPDME